MENRLIEEGRESARRVKLLLLFRLLLVAACLAIILIQEIGRLTGGKHFKDSPFFNAYVLLVGVCVINLLYLLVCRKVKAHHVFAFIQIFIDVVAITLLIYFTGGVESYFNVLYFAAILGAAITVSGRASVLMASLSTTFLAVVAIVYFIAAYRNVPFPLVHPDWFGGMSAEPTAIIAYMVAQGVAYHAVALLGDVLAARLGRAEVLREALLRDMTDGVIAVGVDDTVLFMNEKARELLGYDKRISVNGKKWDEIFKRRSDRKLKELLLNKPPGEYTIELSGANGEQVLVRLKTSVLFDNRRDRIGMLIDLRPLERMKRAEERAGYLEEIAQLAAGIAHEIRNPLASIRACVQELRNYEPKDSPSRRLMEIVFRESDRLEEIVSDFLKFASVQPAKQRRCELSGVLRETISRLREMLREEPIEIETDISYPLYCLGDERQLGQVFFNLGKNAIEAMPNGGTLRITGHVSPNENGTLGVLVTVSDTGKGIPPQDLERIFTPFFSTKETGRGMGLSIASRIVKMHSGSIKVSSEQGKGTCFSVWLPSESGAGAETELT